MSQEFNPPSEKKAGKLFIVATPIGHPDDITLRALNTLKDADIIICEEYRIGSRLLKKMDIQGKEILLLNEHNEKEQTQEILNLLLQKKDLALISDCGTPVFSDPGHFLINQAVLFGIQIVPVPGVSSLMAALSVLDFKLENFLFRGFLPRNSEERKRELQKLKSFSGPIVFMDTPYRLGKLLEEIQSTLGKNRKVTLACNLTQPDEVIYRGPIAEITKKVGKQKAEFILILHEAGKRF